MSSGGTETFGVDTKLAGDNLSVQLTNTSRKKDVIAIWAAYDASGALVELSEKNVTIPSNEHKEIELPAKWAVADYKSSLLLWDKETLTPYSSEIPIT